MRNPGVSYPQLLETNNRIQNCGDETFWLCLTRTFRDRSCFRCRLTSCFRI